MAKIGIAAVDYGESECLKKVALELKARNHQTFEWFGQGRGIMPNKEDVSMVTDGKDVVIVAISEANENEIAIANQARQLNVSVVVYAPGDRAYSKTSAIPLREFCSLLLLGKKADEAEAKRLFPNSQVLTVGNVLHEDGYPVINRVESRRLLGVTDDEKVIFVPGDKSLGVNWPLFRLVIVACHDPKVLNQKPTVVIGIHPGDLNSKNYTELTRYQKVRVSIKTQEELSGIKIIPGCDLLITTGSTLAQVAVYQHKPVIGFLFENLLIDDQREGPIIWDLEEKGVAKMVRDGSIRDLTTSIHHLLSEGGCHDLEAAQTLNYSTPPEPGTTAKRVADVIEKFLAYL